MSDLRKEFEDITSYPQDDTTEKYVVWLESQLAASQEEIARKVEDILRWEETSARLLKEASALRARLKTAQEYLDMIHMAEVTVELEEDEALARIRCYLDEFFALSPSALVAEPIWRRVGKEYDDRQTCRWKRRKTDQKYIYDTECESVIEGGDNGSVEWYQETYEDCINCGKKIEEVK
jgi:hypothetical protein